MFRLRPLAALCLLALSGTVGAPARQADVTKLDRALREWVQHPSPRTRVLIQPRPAAIDRVRHRLAGYLPDATIVSTTPTLIVAQVDARGLRAVAADPDVNRVSADARVRTLATSSLSEDVLLNTEALLPRTYTG